jgi:hypothetical protein
MAEHAKLGASNSHRWMNCAGSVRLSEGIPKFESPYAVEGHLAHEIAAKLLGGESDIIEGEDLSKRPGYHDEMITEVEVYVNVVREAITEATLSGDLVRVEIENKFSLERLGPPRPMFGTADAVVLRKDLLRIFDLKYGKGVFVNVGTSDNPNPQLMYYALGVLLKLKELLDVEITVVQPRIENPDGFVRTVRVTAEQVLNFVDDLMAAAERTIPDDAPLVSGKWCQFCPAAGICPALRDRNMALARSELAPVPEPPAPDTLAPEELAHILDNAHILSDWLAAVRAHASRMVETGEEVPGWKLVDKRAQRKWIDPDKADAYVRRVYKLKTKETRETKFRSPAQIEKLLKGKKIKDYRLDHLYSKDSSGTTLVPLSDKRPAVEPVLFTAEPLPQLPPAEETSSND